MCFLQLCLQKNFKIIVNESVTKVAYQRRFPLATIHIASLIFSFSAFEVHNVEEKSCLIFSFPSSEII